jgi:hypothetical protein
MAKEGFFIAGVKVYARAPLEAIEVAKSDKTINSKAVVDYR